jgi:hypothetical protein
MAGENGPKWAALKKRLTTLDKNDLVGLIKNLHDLSPENRAFLGARFAPSEESHMDVLARYRQRVIDPFYPKRGSGRLNLADGRKAIREYRKATGDAAGTLDLCLSYVEAGTSFTLEFGDIDERFYTSLESVVMDIGKMLRTPEGADQAGTVVARLRVQAEAVAGRVGWGYADFLADAVEEIEEYFDAY